MNTIKCPKCATLIEIDKAMENQIESRLLIEINEKHQEELKRAAAEANTKARVRMEEELRKRGDALKETNETLQSEVKNLSKALLEEQKSRLSAETAAYKKLREEALKIREEAKKEADENHRLKELELQKQLNDTKKALDEALRKAEQGSEQIQGEILELELESLLKMEFPGDIIEEVKKGQRGADILQYVKNQRLEDCGVLLWEVKNAKWNKEWIQKMKEDARRENASIGIIVSRELPDNYKDMQNVEGNIWVTAPRLAPALAQSLRATLIQVYYANKSAENKDAKMEYLYRFLTGVEFRNRIEAMVDGYNTLMAEMESEKRQAEKRWGKQEKAIRAMVGNTYGLYGDLQGITGSKLSIPLLEAAEEGE
ncbi:MAG: DUF2130 domain-containing protein [Defluviitaleaceae bacterium]|nr:DUF2130 domain-containing protein [Defluviitaleaceae bacterium]